MTPITVDITFQIKKENTLMKLLELLSCPDNLCNIESVNIKDDTFRLIGNEPTVYSVSIVTADYGLCAKIEELKNWDE